MYKLSDWSSFQFFHKYPRMELLEIRWKSTFSFPLINTGMWICDVLTVLCYYKKNRNLEFSSNIFNSINVFYFTILVDMVGDISLDHFLRDSGCCIAFGFTYKHSFLFWNALCTFVVCSIWVFLNNWFLWVHYNFMWVCWDW